MHPELENFLEDALQDIRATSAAIGRVVVEPDYEVTPDKRDAAALAEQLRELIDRQADTAAVASGEGHEVRVPEDCPMLAKYFRSITLHHDAVEGPLIEVAPPGNWI